MINRISEKSIDLISGGYLNDDKRKTSFKLGVTGGIGSGKTSVCRVFDVLNIPVFSADREAQEIMENDKRIIRRHQFNSG